MALVLKDRISETTSTSGTGAITLAGATSGFVAFSTIGNGNTTYYCITDGAAWEVGLGTYTSSGNTLARTTVYSNSNGNTTPITLSGGIKNVFGVLPADGIITVSGTSIQVPGTAVLSVANGGTGSNTLTSEAVILGNGTSAVQFVAPGTSSNVLTSNGTTWVSQAPAGGGTSVNTQSFTSSGTWTKPSGCTMVMVLLWGGGGSGSRMQAGFAGGGGGGGELTTITIPAVLLSSTVTVTIGAGGTSPATNNVEGNAGGASTFGSYSDAVGGLGGGSSTTFGGGWGGGRLLGSYAATTDGTTPLPLNVITNGRSVGGGSGGNGSPGMAGSPFMLRNPGISSAYFVLNSYYDSSGTSSVGTNNNSPNWYQATGLKTYTSSTNLPFTNLYSYGGGGGGGGNSAAGLGGNGADGFLAGAGGGGASDTGTGGTGGTSSQITSFSGFTSVGGNGGTNGGAPTNGSGVGAGGGGSENQTAGNGTSGACIVYAW